ncbi:MerR family DNA-binding protein [Amycolatopsis cynarae]|uniref:MerR family DNA-binding protein n=1 Tax=Amycolatopsis cynarae TaxID=2995223 RepID=A0ABY7B965_9PSEU|nr:MerR family DNA-binding protein [Amycolatopsis sp. HUAS 11-8]WAL68495.1 MerR family DNA-binding protein [Amycolatopsis sp. HUAS 11-8]
MILRGKEAGFALEEIRAMIAAPGRAARTAILRHRRDELRARIRAAQASLDMIEGALECEHEDFVRCPHFQSTVADRISPGPPPHVRE